MACYAVVGMLFVIDVLPRGVRDMSAPIVFFFFSAALMAVSAFFLANGEIERVTGKVTMAIVGQTVSLVDRVLFAALFAWFALRRLIDGDTDKAASSDEAWRDVKLSGGLAAFFALSALVDVGRKTFFY